MDNGSDVRTGPGPRRLVVGFDGTPRAWVALRTVEREALRRGATVELLAVRGRTRAVPDRTGGPGARPHGGAGGRRPMRRTRLTTSIGAARQVLMRRQPRLSVSASVLLSDDVEVSRPLLSADLLVLGWTGAAGDLAAGLGAPGVRLLRAAPVPVLVVPAGAGSSEAGPVVLLLGPSTTDRAFGVAIDECRRRGASLAVIGAATELESGHPRRGAPSLVVAAFDGGPGGEGLGEEDAARLVTSSRAPVLLVPPAPDRLPLPRPGDHDRTVAAGRGASAEEVAR